MAKLLMPTDSAISIDRLEQTFRYEYIYLMWGVYYKFISYQLTNIEHMHVLIKRQNRTLARGICCNLVTSELHKQTIDHAARIIPNY